MTNDERASIQNAIWLCQICARLVDVDVVSHPAPLLQEWRDLAEATAFLALRGYEVLPRRSFEKLDAMMPELMAEMRRDLLGKPFTRWFIVLKKTWAYRGNSRPEFVYFLEDHQELMGKLQVCEKYGAISEVHSTNVSRWEFEEDFVDFLLRSPGPQESTT